VPNYLKPQADAGGVQTQKKSGTALVIPRVNSARRRLTVAGKHKKAPTGHNIPTGASLQKLHPAYLPPVGQ